MTHALIINGVPTPLPIINGGFTAGDVTHPLVVLDLWTAEELAAINVLPIVETSIPPGKFSAGSTLTLVDGQVIREHTLADVPLPTVTELAAHASATRWATEIGGITVGGITVHTDDRSKMMLMGARVHASADPGFTTPWKTSDGSFVILDAATITAMSNAVLAHVNACFAREAEVQAAILEGEVTTMAEIDEAFADVNEPWE